LATILVSLLPTQLACNSGRQSKPLGDIHSEHVTFLGMHDTRAQQRATARRGGGRAHLAGRRGAGRTRTAWSSPVRPSLERIVRRSTPVERSSHRVVAFSSTSTSAPCGAESPAPPGRGLQHRFIPSPRTYLATPGGSLLVLLALARSPTA